MNDLRNKRILITGGSGSIGTYLIDLLDKSNKILNIDIKHPDKSIINKVIYHPINTIDTYKINEIISIFKPEILFHLAAVFQRTTETLDFRNSCFSTNLIGSHNVLEACARNKIKHIIFASSYLIYDQNQYLFEKDNLLAEPVSLNENSPINPRNITGVAKLYTEKELEFYKEMGIITTSLRIFRVYGPKNEDIIDRWISTLLLGKRIKVYGKEQAFDYIHAKDCALGCFQAAKVQESGIYNIGTGIPTSIEKILEILKKSLGNKFKMSEVVSEELQKYEKSCADLTKSKKVIKFNPKVPIDEGIQLNIEAIRGRILNE